MLSLTKYLSTSAEVPGESCLIPFFFSVGSGGICEKYRLSVEPIPGTSTFKSFKMSLNSGIITFQNYNNFVPMHITEITFCHEIGHNFGSPVAPSFFLFHTDNYLGEVGEECHELRAIYSVTDHCSLWYWRLYFFLGQ